MSPKQCNRIVLAATMLTSIVTCPPSFARDLAGIQWREYVEQSELVFTGQLVKAELLEATSQLDQNIAFTYAITRIHKGKLSSSPVTFKAPSSWDINKTVGAVAIIALKRTGDRWVLSVDQRSCWTLYNEMRPDFGGIPTYRIPRNLIYNIPQRLGESLTVKRQYADGAQDRNVFLYTQTVLEKQLGGLMK